MAVPVSDNPGKLRNWVVIAAYPVVVMFGLALFFVLREMGAALWLAAYLPAAIAAVLITMHELIFPERLSWRPGATEICNDAIFLAVVQIALPYLLSLLLVLAAAGAMAQYGLTVSGLWPHEWPIAWQAVLMLLTGDFMRYWMHRAFHRYPVLWRLHAVHHSPKRLYWLNVGRFHPLEKALQYGVDTLPFALLGVSQDVLALYFVFYAINGFFQHSNCEVRLGWLNYLVSGPELHRWHHSLVLAESNANYGNNLIVWDWLFRTRFLPDDRRVLELGLLNRSYPTGFANQLVSPFGTSPNRE